MPFFHKMIRPIGSLVQAVETRDFTEMMINCDMIELHTGGRKFTWTNGHVYSRTDKTIVNVEWTIRMPPLQVLAMEPLFSDHSFLCLKIDDQKGTKKKPFRF